MKFSKVAALVFASSLTISGAFAQDDEDAGHSNDYRTFTADGVAYGQIGDSYTADLVMYLPGGMVST